MDREFVCQRDARPFPGMSNSVFICILLCVSSLVSAIMVPMVDNRFLPLIPLLLCFVVCLMVIVMSALRKITERFFGILNRMDEKLMELGRLEDSLRSCSNQLRISNSLRAKKLPVSKDESTKSGDESEDENGPSEEWEGGPRYPSFPETFRRKKWTKNEPVPKRSSLTVVETNLKVMELLEERIRKLEGTLPANDS